MTISHSDSSPRIGQTIAGKFVIEAVIAVGGIGTVYRARQLGLDRVVALKLLREEFARDEDFLERFKREARAASRLEHPNSVRVLDFGEHDDGSMLYLAMEYVEGRTLYDVIRQDAPLPEARIVDILSQVLAAVGVAHDMGVVHRDLKPENIMIIRGTSDEGEHAELVKVLDFGIASLGNVAHDAGAYAEGPRMTKRGLIVGTPEYMAPEQADGRADAAQRPLLAGRRAVPDADRPPPLPRRQPAHGRGQAHHRGAGAAVADRGGEPEARGGLHARAGQDARRALWQRARDALGAAGGNQPGAEPSLGAADRDQRRGLAVGRDLRNARRRRAAPPRAAGGRPCAGDAVRGGAGRAQLVGEVAARAGGRQGGGGGGSASGGGARWRRMGTRMRRRPRPRPRPRRRRRRLATGKIPTMRGRRRAGTRRLRRAIRGTRAAHGSRTPAAPRTGGKGAPKNEPGVSAKGSAPGDGAPGAKTGLKAGAAVTEPTAITPPVAPAPLDLGHASVSIASITSTSAIPGANIRAALSRSPLVRCYREALHAAGAAATGTAVLHLKIDIAGYVTSTELEGAQFLPGVKPCVEKSTRGVRVKDVDTGEASADVTLTFACPP